jgi:hypothetical protein
MAEGANFELALVVTPSKSSTTVNISPTTKWFYCMVCCEHISRADYRRKLFKGDQKTNSCLLLEKTLCIDVDITDSARTNIVCRTCVRELQRCDDIICKKQKEFGHTTEFLKVKYERETTKRQINDTSSLSKKRKSLGPLFDKQI